MSTTPLRPLTLAIAIALLLGSALAVSVLGQEDDPEHKREVKVETDDEGVKIELKEETEDSEDTFEVRFDFDNARFEAEHKVENGDNETEDKLEVTFQSLAEYVDDNDNGRYDAGEPIVSAWRLGAEGFDDDDRGKDYDKDDDKDDEEDENDPDDPTKGRIEWTGARVSDLVFASHEGKRIVVNGTLGDTGTFELRMLVFGAIVDLGHDELDPTSVKFDIVIDDFPYTQNDTAVALFMDTEAKREVDHDDEADEDEAGVALPATEGLTLVFTWKGNATVDGVDTTVATTELSRKEEVEPGETKQERRFVLSYARGAAILHDPEFRMLDETPPVEAPGPGLLLGVAALALAACTGRRRSPGRGA